MIQAIGFALNLTWVHLDALTIRGEPTSTCLTQAVFIQAGDVASAAWACAIAIHTGVIVGLRYKPSTRVIGVTMGAIWSAVVLITIIGPVAIESDALGPFCA